MHSYTFFPGDRGADGRLLGKCVCGLWEDKATPLSKCPNARDPAPAPFSPPMMVPVPVDLVAKLKKIEMKDKNQEDFVHAVVTTEAEWISHLQEHKITICWIWLGTPCDFVPQIPPNYCKSRPDGMQPKQQQQKLCGIK